MGKPRGFLLPLTLAWFRMQRLLYADAAGDMLARENRGFSVDASVRITLCRPQLRVYFQPLEHLLLYCARPPFALDRLFVRCGEDGRITGVGDLPPLNGTASRERIWGCDAAPNLVPAELLAMQGR